MTNKHPITPPPELVQQWVDAWLDAKVKHVELYEFLATQGSRWGADQELEKCCEWMLANARFLDAGWIERLRTARRPKPLSLKQQALEWCNDYIDPDGVIRRALEALPDAD